MSALKSIRTGLATNAATCTAVKQAYDHVPGIISSTPAVTVRPVRIGLGETFEGASSYLLAVRVMVQIGDQDDAQDTLDNLLETTGTGSLIAALESNVTLAGVAHSVRIIDVDDYGIEDIGGTEVLGATINVEVFA